MGMSFTSHMLVHSFSHLCSQATLSAWWGGRRRNTWPLPDLMVLGKQVLKLIMTAEAEGYHGAGTGTQRSLGVWCIREGFLEEVLSELRGTGRVELSW